MSPFTAEYYMRGVEGGLSNYTDYHWMPDATLAWAHTFRRLLDVPENARVLDVGAARGYYVKALRMLGIEAFGYDISEWAVSNCDPDVKPYLSNHLNGSGYDLIYSKDCCEHIEPNDLGKLLKNLLSHTEKLFIIVPLACENGGGYVHPKEEADKTHINRWPLQDWIEFVASCSTSFVTSGSYMYPGLKPGSCEVQRGYGFILATKI